MDPLKKSTYQNGTSKETALTDADRQPELGMTSSSDGGVVPIYRQSLSTAAASSTSNGPTSNGQPISAPPQANRTTFPVDKTIRASAQLFWYTLLRRYFLGAPLLRWITTTLLCIGVLWFLADFSGGWVGTVVAVAAALFMLVSAVRWRRRDFVNFSAEPTPDAGSLESMPSPLKPNEKIPVHATGRFSVEQNEARFTWLPGFYRTFATREHAIMCLAQADQFESAGFWARLGERNPDELGMWYVFLTPDVIDQIRLGRLDFGNTPQPALAIDYTLSVPAKNLVQRLIVGDRTITETLYLACESEEIRARIFADLQHDLPNREPASVV